MFSGVPNGPWRLSPPPVHPAVHNSGCTKRGGPSWRYIPSGASGSPVSCSGPFSHTRLVQAVFQSPRFLFPLAAAQYFFIRGRSRCGTRGQGIPRALAADSSLICSPTGRSPPGRSLSDRRQRKSARGIDPQLPERFLLPASIGAGVPLPCCESHVLAATRSMEQRYFNQNHPFARPQGGSKPFMVGISVVCLR